MRVPCYNPDRNGRTVVARVDIGVVLVVVIVVIVVVAAAAGGGSGGGAATPKRMSRVRHVSTGASARSPVVTIRIARGSAGSARSARADFSARHVLA